MSGKTLCVQGFSPKSTNGMIQLFIENNLPTDADVEDVTMNDDKALVVLSRGITDGELRELQNLLSQKSLQDHILSISRLRPALLVTELPDDISEEHLELYFEYEKYGGGPVTDVQLYAQQRCAVITFAEEATVSSVLAHGSHKISEKIVKVEICKPFSKPEEKSEAKDEPMEHSPTTHQYEEIPYTSGHPDPSSDHPDPSSDHLKIEKF